MSDDLEQDIWRDDEILNKIRTNKAYAQNVYAAMCNMRWCPRDIFPALRQDPEVDLWSCSWRGAGGLVASWRGEGDYMDWYCSGMGGVAAIEEDLGREEELESEFKARGSVPEGVVTDEVRVDFARLGWFPVPWEDDK